MAVVEGVTVVLKGRLVLSNSIKGLGRDKMAKGFLI